MSDQTPRPQAPINLDLVFSQLARAITAQTNAIRLVDAKTVALSRFDGEILSALSSARERQDVEADAQRERIELAITIAKDARDGVYEALRLLRENSDRLRSSEDRISDQIEGLEDRITPLGVPTLPRDPTGPVPALPAPAEPEEGISLRQGKVHAVFGLGTILAFARRHGPWLGWAAGLLTAAYHAIRYKLGL